MRIISIIVLVILLVFIYEDNLQFKKNEIKLLTLLKQLNQKDLLLKMEMQVNKTQNVYSEEIIQKLTIDLVNLKEKYLSKSTKTTKITKESKVIIYPNNKLEYIHIHKKKEKITDFNNLLKKQITIKKDKNSFSINPNLSYDEENRDLKLESLQIELKKKF
ncbi:MAG: hypothetical protein HRT40_12260 [Campylobacteraceae bacterium]|nr:hypothetical protein [Campylobacteraceae bacterium]